MQHDSKLTAELRPFGIMEKQRNLDGAVRWQRSCARVVPPSSELCVLRLSNSKCSLFPLMPARNPIEQAQTEGDIHRELLSWYSKPLLSRYARLIPSATRGDAANLV